jgi:tRNA A-37 threonylcarbamoyl transferase component Bud32
MSENRACPDSGQLRALLAGTLAEADQERLSQHMEQCATCQRTLEQLGEAQSQGVGPETQAAATSDSAADGAAGKDDLSYLASPAQAGNLGRLDHYEVLAVIGKGGFGTVFKARDEKLDRLVAIKVLSPALAGSGTARKRFIREAKAAAALRNDHVIAIHGVGDAGPVPYLVMELISGVSLQDKLDAKGTLEVKEIVRIGMQIAHGLAAAHQVGLVHRDIKPANILLENGVERVKITDFGLARAVDDASVTQSGTVAGTPMYMSPEQAEGLPIDHRSDLFSLGTVLYAMCTGHPPFRASGTHAVLKRVIDASPRPIREINNEIPDWLAGIIAKLHAKKPEDRHQTAKEVAELLGQRLAELQVGRAGALRDRSAAAATADARPKAGRSAFRRMLPWLGAGALVLVTAGLVFFFVQYSAQKPSGQTAVPMDADQVLQRLVGTWSVHDETTLPEQKTMNGVIRYEWVPNGKFLRAYSSYRSNGGESLTVLRRDGDSKAFQRWFFAAAPGLQAIEGLGNGQWDTQTATLTWHGTLPLFRKITHEDHWIDDNNSETRTEIKDFQGKVVMRQTKKMHRLTTNETVGPKLPKDPKRPAEFSVVDELIGSWISKAEVTLAELGNQKVPSQSTHQAVSALAGRLVEAQEHNQAVGRKDYWIVGWDEFRRVYRFWHFGADGEALEADGAWDKAQRKLTWDSLDGRFKAAWTFRSPDEYHTVTAAKDAQGRRLYEVVGIARRVDAPERRVSP